jgi:hypothetical protein
MGSRGTLVAVSLAAAVCALQCKPEEGPQNRPPVVDPRKPGWWPDPAPRNGLRWPPPRPDNYDGEVWPPLRETGEDPQFWVDLYGETPNPETDPDFTQSGRKAKNGFGHNFHEINHMDERPPGCGLHMIRLFAGQFVDSCNPFPEVVSRQLCATVLNPKAAQERCRVVCQSNPEKCRRDRVFTPALEVQWTCVQGCTLPDAACPDDYANCIADYLCDCWEN